MGISKAIVNNNDLSALLFPFALKNETQEVYKKLPTLALMVGEMIPFTIVRKIFMGKMQNFLLKCDIKSFLCTNQLYT